MINSSGAFTLKKCVAMETGGFIMRSTDGTSQICLFINKWCWLFAQFLLYFHFSTSVFNMVEVCCFGGSSDNVCYSVKHHLVSFP